MNQQSTPPVRLLSATEVCAMLGMQKTWLYDLAKQGRLPCFRFGRSIRFSVADIEAFLAESRQGAQSEVIGSWVHPDEMKER